MQKDNEDSTPPPHTHPFDKHSVSLAITEALPQCSIGSMMTSRAYCATFKVKYRLNRRDSERLRDLPKSHSK